MATEKKRVSKTVVKGVTEQQFNDAMGAYATADAQASKIIAQMDVEVTKIREKYAEQLEPLRETCERQFEVVQTYCEENKATLFDKRRSWETTHGTVGFRTGTPKLKLLPKKTWATVLDNLNHYLPDYVRTISEPAKDRLLTDRDLPEVATVLPKVGLMVDQDEKFFIEIKKEG